MYGLTIAGDVFYVALEPEPVMLETQPRNVGNAAMCILYQHKIGIESQVWGSMVLPSKYANPFNAKWND